MRRSVEVECACPRQVCTFACCSHDVSPELKKDPGIPNLYPFKEELLQQIEDKRQQVGQLCVGDTCVSSQVVHLCWVSQCFLCEVKNGKLVTGVLQDIIRT